MDRPPLTSDLLADAWARVAVNHGCGGVDGVTVEESAHRAPEECRALAQALAQGTYRALPLLRIVVEKRPGSTETRTLLVPCLRDRSLQTAVAREVSRSYEGVDWWCGC